MVESFKESKKNSKKHVPNITRIKEISFPSQWNEKYNYPIEEEKAADYLVRYESVEDFGGTYLIEAADSNLRTEIKQLEACADIFDRLGVKIDNYLIVLKKLSRQDNKMYKLINCLPKPFKEIKKYSGRLLSKKLTIKNKKVRFIYQKDIKEV